MLLQGSEEAERATLEPTPELLPAAEPRGEIQLPQADIQLPAAAATSAPSPPPADGPAVPTAAAAAGAAGAGAAAAGGVAAAGAVTGGVAAAGGGVAAALVDGVAPSHARPVLTGVDTGQLAPVHVRPASAAPSHFAPVHSRVHAAPALVDGGAQPSTALQAGRGVQPLTGQARAPSPSMHVAPQMVGRPQARAP